MARVRVLLPLMLAAALAACSATAPESQQAASTADGSPAATEEPTAAATPSATAEPTTAAADAELAVDWTVSFTMTAPAGWAEFDDSRTTTALEIEDDSGLRTVLNVFVKTPDTPEAWLERLTTIAALDATEPQPVEIGGAAGHVFDVQLSEEAPACAAGGGPLGGNCYIIHPAEAGWVWVVEDGRPARIWVLAVGDETVVLMSDAREDRFEAWTQTIDDIVATIEWQES